MATAVTQSQHGPAITSGPTVNSRSRALTTALWVVSVATAGMFLMAGTPKLAGAPQMVALFDAIGVGQWFRYFTGIVEVVGALMLLVPKATLVGVGLLVCTMVGALLVHMLVTGVGPQTVAVVVLLLMLFAVAIRRIRTTKEPQAGKGASEAGLTKAGGA